MSSKDHFYRLFLPFKIYAGTECLLKGTFIKGGKNKTLYQKHILNSIGAKLVCIDNRFTLPTIIFEGENCINKFIKWIFRQKEQINQIITNHFNKKLKMTTENEKNYQESQDCWFSMKN